MWLPFCLTHYKRLSIANRYSTSLFPMLSYSFYRSKHKVAEYMNASLRGFEKASVPKRSELLSGVSGSTLINICKLWCYTLSANICIFGIFFTPHCKLKICIFSFRDFLSNNPCSSELKLSYFSLSNKYLTLKKLFKIFYAAHFSSKKLLCYIFWTLSRMFILWILTFILNEGFVANMLM